MRKRHASDRNGCRKIVLTGGPGGGKSTAADLFRREIGERIVIVPEAATILYTGGFPRTRDTHARQAIQAAIYHVQVNLERAYADLFPGRVLLCDRGTIDGSIYWPGPEGEFFAAMGTSLEEEYSRYDAVVFFQSAAVGGISIEGGNPIRVETVDEATKLDARLFQAWKGHPRFTHVPHDASFMNKIHAGFAAFKTYLERC